VLGVVTGAIAIGTTATSTSTTTIIIIRTTISIETSIAARDKVIGSITRNTEAMRPTGIEEPRTNSVAMRVSSPGTATDRVDPAGLEASVELAVQVAQVELGVRVAPAVQELVPVAEALERVLAEAVPELAPVAEVLETGHPHDRLEVLLGTKSVTAAHHRALALVLAAEDLAAVAEVTHEPAAAEAVAAWEAAA